MNVDAGDLLEIVLVEEPEENMNVCILENSVTTVAEGAPPTSMDEEPPPQLRSTRKIPGPAGDDGEAAAATTSVSPPASRRAGRRPARLQPQRGTAREGSAPAQSPPPRESSPHNAAAVTASPPQILNIPGRVSEESGRGEELGTEEQPRSPSAGRSGSLSDDCHLQGDGDGAGEDEETTDSNSPPTTVAPPRRRRRAGPARTKKLANRPQGGDDERGGQMPTDINGAPVRQVAVDYDGLPEDQRRWIQRIEAACKEGWGEFEEAVAAWCKSITDKKPARREGERGGRKKRESRDTPP
ncbi:synapsin-1-like [Ischnura elegans]|uniref:synapsin-1-like n=1 Tax=Ischnura elegans TaxID=197161 RepID=UPI001ED8A81A|nr:synapsin-1-like [Ischnura elegans]